MAGLAAAARARELGAEPVVLEKGSRAGGSMLLSSGVIWRYRSLESFREECPGGDPALQGKIITELDEALDWVAAIDPPIVHDTGNPNTIGKQFDPTSLTHALARVASDVRLGEGAISLAGFEGPVLLATGGFPVRLARERRLLLRANAWSEGDGLELASSRGAARAGDHDEFYGRAMPAPPARIEERDFVRLSQLYGRFADVVSESGEGRFEGDPGWSETHLVQAIARWPGGRAWYRVHEDKLGERVRDRTVGEMIEAARGAGAVVRDEPPFVSVLVRASVTQPLGGLRIDERTRVLGEDGAPIENLYAAGADVGGISTGGYSSGLAAALVFGRIAAEEALS
jgi:FAD binding domain-containing protein